MVSLHVASPPMDLPGSGHPIELADVVRRFGPEYLSQYGPRMMPSQRRALADIATCCTRQLGGRLYHCQRIARKRQYDWRTANHHPDEVQGQSK